MKKSAPPVHSWCGFTDIFDADTSSLGEEMAGNCHSFSSYADHPINQPHRGPAERGLLVGVLEMAVRDLGPVAASYCRKSAITWFTVKSKDLPQDYTDYMFSFSDIIDYLDLGFKELSYISKKLETAKRYEIDRVKRHIEASKKETKCTSAE